MKITEQSLYQFATDLTHAKVSQHGDLANGVILVDVFKAVLPKTSQTYEHMINTTIVREQSATQSENNFTLLQFLFKWAGFPDGLCDFVLLQDGDRVELLNMLVVLYYVYLIMQNNTEDIQFDLRVLPRVAAFLQSDRVVEVARGQQGDIQELINELRDISISDTEELLRRSQARSAGELQRSLEDLERMYDGGLRGPPQGAAQQRQQTAQPDSAVGRPVGRSFFQPAPAAAGQAQEQAAATRSSYRPPAELRQTRPVQTQLEQSALLQSSVGLGASLGAPLPPGMQQLLQNPNLRRVESCAAAIGDLRETVQAVDAVLTSLLTDVLPRLAKYRGVGSDGLKELQRTLHGLPSGLGLARISEQLAALSELQGQLERQNSILAKLVDGKQLDATDIKHLDRYTAVVYLLLRSVASLKAKLNQRGINHYSRICSGLQAQFQVVMGGDQTSPLLLSDQQIDQRLDFIYKTFEAQYGETIRAIRNYEPTEQLKRLLGQLRAQNNSSSAGAGIDTDLLQFISREEFNQFRQFLDIDCGQFDSNQNFCQVLKVQNQLSSQYISQLLDIVDQLGKKFTEQRENNELIMKRQIRLITLIQQNAFEEIQTLAAGIPLVAQKDGEIAYLQDQVNFMQSEIQEQAQIIENNMKQVYELQRQNRQLEVSNKKFGQQKGELLQIVLQLKGMVESGRKDHNQLDQINSLLGKHFSLQQTMVSSEAGSLQDTAIKRQQEHIKDLSMKLHEVQARNSQLAGEVSNFKTQYSLLEANYQALQRQVARQTELVDEDTE